MTESFFNLARSTEKVLDGTSATQRLIELGTDFRGCIPSGRSGLHDRPVGVSAERPR